MKYSTDRTDFLNQLAEWPSRLPLVMAFDIETGALPQSQIEQFFQSHIAPLPPLQPFNPVNVKLGNLKSAAAIENKKNRAAISHVTDRHILEREHAENLRREKQQFFDDGALSAHTGEVLAIGYGFLTTGHPKIFLDITAEYDILTLFWSVFNTVRKTRGVMIGFNSNRFDVPFITNRSWVKQIVCPYVLTQYNKMEDNFIDLANIWQMGRYGNRPQDGRIKLDQLAKVLGLAGKLPGVTGADFAKLLIANPDRAKEYLTSDIVTTLSVAERLGQLAKYKAVLQSKDNTNAE